MTVGGCKDSAQVFDTSEGGFFSKPMDVFSKPVWATGKADKTVSLGPSGPVNPEDLVGADGRCGAPVEAAAPAASPAAAAAAAPAPPADRPVGSMAGDLASAPMPAATPASVNPNDTAPAQPGAPPVMGGIALGMSECDAVRRAGLPSNVNIGAGPKGDRKVVLTYLGGPWPGIYTFDAGRLKEIDRAPEPPTPPKAQKKKAKKPVKPKTANRATRQEYVQ